ncbi:headcase protein [Anabrus simplex]|uniref:headcase protein n=1 Tax=Anabrus simplex TaxID=316456 RepID=UPI0034DD8136
MAPRRNNNHHGHGHATGGGAEVQGLGIDPETIENHDANVTRCCVPTGDCLRASNNASGNNGCSDPLIHLDDLRDVVKVTCNNDHCSVGQYMHRECFDAWEQTVLTYLKSCGRARSWSERQRHQNLWTKKGYDLAFKACGCLCGRGHLKKDLDWVAPPPSNGVVGGGRAEENGDSKKKKKRNKQNTKPTLAISAHPAYHPNSNGQGQQQQNGRSHTEAQLIGGGEVRGRTGSLSSSTGSSSPPASASEPSVSPVHSGGSSAGVGKKKSKFEFFSDRSRHGNGGNGIFSRRQDFSSFNSLPKHKLNSYHIKMEDEGNHGNDDTRCFILSTLAGLHASKVSCILCQSSMMVFDRYPLVDGTFFLSPRQHSKSCLEVKIEGRTLFLSAVCMACLEGWGPGRTLRCRFCGTPWDGSSLVLGTMYSYDIFAAMHCCPDRSRCNSCQTPLLRPQQRLNYFSHYSHQFPCPHCRAVDTHFVKPVAYCYAREVVPGWP